MVTLEYDTTQVSSKNCKLYCRNPDREELVVGPSDISWTSKTSNYDDVQCAQYCCHVTIALDWNGVDVIWDFEYCARKRFMDICVVQHLIVGGGIMIVYSRIQGCRRTTIVIINGNLNGVLHRDEILQQHHIPFIKETCHHISEGQCQSTRYTCLDQYAAMTCHFARPICQQ